MNLFCHKPDCSPGNVQAGLYALRHILHHKYQWDPWITTFINT